MPKFDYWEDDFDGRPPHGEGYHDGPHGNPYDDYPHDHHHPHPPYDGRRHQPVDVGKVDTTKMHDRYDMHVPFHMPPWGFKFPKLEKAFVPGSTPQEQVAYLLNRVDTMIDYFNHYDDKVWGAYNAVVHSALGNEAYYREITREEGYLADGSTPYTVIHIPYLDRAERPIFLELGLAYNNTTNNGVKENVFEASQNRVADKLIPAFNIADGWEGKAMLKGAPIQSVYTEGKFTLAVTDNGFLKIYPNTVAYEQLNRDRIRNAMGVQGVLINNGAKTPEQYADNGGELLARVGIGMNYDTKERIIVIVNGNPTPPNNASATGATADMFADIFARYGCTVAVETANNGSAVAMDKGQMIYMPDTALTGTIPTVPSLNCYWYITKRRHYHNQYVKDVADLIQKVGQNKWRCEIALQSCDFLKGRVNELQRDLDAEVQNRIDADEELQANIDAEEQARIDADEQLQDNIDAEAEARRQADAQLQDNIDAEATAREQGDNALDTRITNEVATLNERITQVVTTLNNAIDTERQARIDGDNALSTRITNEVATLNALIDAEEQARIAGDTALQNSLAQLRADYTAFLTTYANDLAETRRLLTALRSDISTIQGQIASLQSNLAAVNTSITAILATINTIEQSFENIKTAFTTLQSDWHDYKDDVDAEIAQMEQDWATYQTTIMSEVETLVREIIDDLPPSGGCDCVLTEEVYYYIDPVNGSDDNDGSENAPFQTFMHFNDIAKRSNNGGKYYVTLMHNMDSEGDDAIHLDGIDAPISIQTGNALSETVYRVTGVDIYNCNEVVFDNLLTDGIYVDNSNVKIDVVDDIYGLTARHSHIEIGLLNASQDVGINAEFSDIYIGDIKSGASFSLTGNIVKWSNLYTPTNISSIDSPLSIDETSNYVDSGSAS